jgi:hypothetical protein
VISPIKDLRHNSKSLSLLLEIIPANSDIESFLLFAGDVEINLAQAGRRVIAHTNKFVIYDFWKSLFDDCENIAQNAEHFFPFESEEVFRVFQGMYFKNKNPFARAALFFLLNRCSSDGMISHGSLDQKNYNPLALTYVRRFRQINFDVKHDKGESLASALLKTNSNTDYVFLPIGKFSYNLLSDGMNRGEEETAISHKDIESVVGQLDTRTIINYKYHPQVLKLYQDYSILMVDAYGRPTTNRDKTEEVLIANFRLS